eukprot:TRINITY_DN9399_c0_g3_i1.p1 TRINITY_DN9399_c0_g3~~TRINITY_DN9399_c0_g3_i1.p1  ORF type:complete len:580 (-),score=86.90 TRINITY_DN9399_c0_g3_i1:345-2084(-)
MLRALLSLLLASTRLTGARGQADVAPFFSEAVNDAMWKVIGGIRDPYLQALFNNTFPDTLNTTIDYTPPSGQAAEANKSDTFIITGDIPAMWLRDSTNQVLPYIEYVNQDRDLDQMIKGLLRRQSKCILHDAYANAFGKNPYPANRHKDDNTTLLNITELPSGTKRYTVVDAMKAHPLVFERKFEIDSLAAFLRLSYEYSMQKVNSPAGIDSVFQDQDDKEAWLTTVQLVMQTAREQQAGTDEEYDKLEGHFRYTFARTTNEPTDSLMHTAGPPARRCGLIRSGFRPSDDANSLPFHVPGNVMFASYLGKLSESTSGLLARVDAAVAQDAAALAEEVRQAILKHAVVSVPSLSPSPVFAYEVDGFGNYYLMDDANIPGLLSLPYLGFLDNDQLWEVYLNTRKTMVLSVDRNPFFFAGHDSDSGLNVSGVGGAHVYLDAIWPMAITMQGLTAVMMLEEVRQRHSGDASSKSMTGHAPFPPVDQLVSDVKAAIRILVNTHADTYCIHESFQKTRSSTFTRPWFAWANSLFGEFIIKVFKVSPEILSTEIFSVKPNATTIHVTDIVVPMPGCTSIKQAVTYV